MRNYVVKKGDDELKKPSFENQTPQVRGNRVPEPSKNEEKK